MYKINKLLFRLTGFAKRFKKESPQKDGGYLSSPKFLEDVKRAVEKGAEEQTRIMHKAGMQWSNES